MSDSVYREEGLPTQHRRDRELSTQGIIHTRDRMLWEASGGVGRRREDPAYSGRLSCIHVGRVERTVV